MKTRYHVWPNSPVAAAPPSKDEMADFAARLGGFMKVDKSKGEMGWYFVCFSQKEATGLATALRLVHGLSCAIKTKRWRR